MRKNIALLVLFLIIFIDTMGYGLLIPVLLRIINQAAENNWLSQFSFLSHSVLYGFIIAVGPLAYLIGAPLIGSFSDKWGRKNTLAFCLIVSLIGFILPIIGIFKKAISLIIWGRLIAGFASASQPVAQAAVVDISDEKSKARNLAYIAFAMTLAMAAGPLLGGYLSDPKIYSGFNYSTPFMAASVLVIINLLLLFFIWREPLRENQQHRLLTLKESKLAYTSMFRQPALKILLLLMFFYEFSWSLYFQYSAYYLNQAHHYSVETTSLFASYLAFWMCIGLLIIYPLIIKYFRLLKLLQILLAVNTASLAFCAVLSQFDLVQWIFSISLVLGVGMVYPTLLAMMTQIEPKKHGWVMGSAASMLSAAWMASGFVMGELANIALNFPLCMAFFFMLISFYVSYKKKNLFSSLPVNN